MAAPFKISKRTTKIWYRVTYAGKPRFESLCDKVGIREFRRLRGLLKYKKKLTLHRVKVTAEELIVS